MLSGRSKEINEIEFEWDTSVSDLYW